MKDLLNSKSTVIYSWLSVKRRVLVGTNRLSGLLSSWFRDGFSSGYCDCNLVSVKALTSELTSGNVSGVFTNDLANVSKCRCCNICYRQTLQTRSTLHEWIQSILLSVIISNLLTLILIASSGTCNNMSWFNATRYLLRNYPVQITLHQSLYVACHRLLTEWRPWI